MLSHVLMQILWNYLLRSCRRCTTTSQNTREKFARSTPFHDWRHYPLFQQLNYQIIESLKSLDQMKRPITPRAERRLSNLFCEGDATEVNWTNESSDKVVKQSASRTFRLPSIIKHSTKNEVNCKVHRSHAIFVWVIVIPLQENCSLIHLIGMFSVRK